MSRIVEERAACAFVRSIRRIGLSAGDQSLRTLFVLFASSAVKSVSLNRRGRWRYSLEVTKGSRLRRGRRGGRHHEHLVFDGDAVPDLRDGARGAAVGVHG